MHTKKPTCITGQHSITLSKSFPISSRSGNNITKKHIHNCTAVYNLKRLHISLCHYTLTQTSLLHRNLDYTARNSISDSCDSNYSPVGFYSNKTHQNIEISRS